MKRSLTLLLFVLSLSASAQFSLVSIDSVQRVPFDSLTLNKTRSLIEGDTVRIRGAVTFDPRLSALGAASNPPWYQTFVQDTNSTSTWSGINVRMFPAADTNNVLFFDNFVKGNIVEFTGIVGEFRGGGANINPNSGETQINLLPIASSVVGFTTAPIRPRVLPITDFMQNQAGVNVYQPTTGEKYEGMYVEFQNVVVGNLTVNAASQRISWRIQDANGNSIGIRDNSSRLRPPFVSSPLSSSPNPNAPVFIQQNKVYSFIRGVIVEVVVNVNGVPTSEYALAPLDTSDIGPVLASPPIVDSVVFNPIVPTSTQTVTVQAQIKDLDGTVTSAVLGYSIGANNTIFADVTMIPMAQPDMYTATIPAQPNGTIVNFRIKAVDNAGGVTWWPDSLATRNSYRVWDTGLDRISRIQETHYTNGASLYNGKTVPTNIRGVMMSSVDPTDLGRIIVQDGNGQWSGIIVMPGLNNDLVSRFRGDSILITQAKVSEINNLTTLEDVTATYINSGASLYQGAKISIDSVANRAFNYLEPYESVFVKFDTVYVVNQNPDDPSNFGEFSVYSSTPSTIGMRIDDFAQSLNTPPLFNLDSTVLGQKMDYIQGILSFSFGNWKLMPRNKSDMQGYFTQLNMSSTNFNATDLNLTISNPYPNPTQSEWNIEISAQKAGKFIVKLTDVSGRTIAQNQVNHNGGTYRYTANTNLSAGIYFITVGNGSQEVVKKLVIR